MSLNLEGKKEVVSEVIANIAKAQTMVLAEYRGTVVVGMTKLRADARSQDPAPSTVFAADRSA